MRSKQVAECIHPKTAVTMALMFQTISNAKHFLGPIVCEKDGSILGQVFAGATGRHEAPARPFCKYPVSKLAPVISSGVTQTMNTK